VLAIDAFSSDSIPVHLITREAVELYARHIADGGIIAIHISNRFLNLKPVLANIAQATGLAARLVTDSPADDNARLQHRLGAAGPRLPCDISIDCRNALSAGRPARRPAPAAPAGS
jgi:hypothetical protein